MELPLSAALADLVVLERTGSTNDEVRGRAAAGADLLTVVTLDQQSGRGRLDRTWVTPPGRGLAASALLRMHDRAAVPQDRWGWIPLIAGTAMAHSVAKLLPGAEVALKWPNDVLVGGRKVSGILTEAIADHGAVLVGAGVNLDLDEAELPTPQATSLVAEGAVARGAELADAVLSGWLAALANGMRRLAEHAGDVGAGGIRAEVVAVCATIGRAVEVQLPGGDGFTGLAVGIDVHGRLLVERDDDSVLAEVAAGDVTHLRHG